MAVDAVIIAGYNPNKPDPLAEYAGITRKAAIDLAGHPMIWWVAHALRSSPRIGRLTVVGISAEDGIDFGEEINYVPNQTSHLENCVAGLRKVLESNPSARQAVLASGDIPLLTQASVEWLLDAGDKIVADFYYPIIQDKVMEAQFPGSKRSYVPAQEGRFCGGDIFLVRPALMAANIEKVHQLMANRKNYLAQARIIGLKYLLKALLRQLTLADVEEVGRRILNARVAAVQSPYADLGMDVDKPAQLELARQILAQRQIGEKDLTQPSRAQAATGPRTA